MVIIGFQTISQRANQFVRYNTTTIITAPGQLGRPDPPTDDLQGHLSRPDPLATFQANLAGQIHLLTAFEAFEAILADQIHLLATFQATLAGRIHLLAWLIELFYLF